MAETVSLFLADLGVLNVIAVESAHGGSDKEPKVVKFIKVADSKTPALYQALANKQMFPLAVVTFRRHTPEGTREIYFRLRLIQARVTALELSRDSDPSRSAKTGSAKDPPQTDFFELTCLQVIPDAGDAPAPKNYDAW